MQDIYLLNKLAEKLFRILNTLIFNNPYIITALQLLTAVVLLPYIAAMGFTAFVFSYSLGLELLARTLRRAYAETAEFFNIIRQLPELLSTVYNERAHNIRYAIRTRSYFALIRHGLVTGFNLVFASTVIFPGTLVYQVGSIIASPLVVLQDAVVAAGRNTFDAVDIEINSSLFRVMRMSIMRLFGMEVPPDFLATNNARLETLNENVTAMTAVVADVRQLISDSNATRSAEHAAQQRSNQGLNTKLTAIGEQLTALGTQATRIVEQLQRNNTAMQPRPNVLTWVWTHMPPMVTILPTFPLWAIHPNTLRDADELEMPLLATARNNEERTGESPAPR